MKCDICGRNIDERSAYWLEGTINPIDGSIYAICQACAAYYTDSEAIEQIEQAK